LVSYSCFKVARSLDAHMAFLSFIYSIIWVNGVLMKGIWSKLLQWYTKSKFIHGTLRHQSSTTSEEHSTVYWGGTVEMVRACEKNVNQQNCPEVAGMEAKYRPAQRQAKETMDWQCQRGCRSQRIYTEGDRTISTVPGQKPMEKLSHWQAIGVPVQWYKVQGRGSWVKTTCLELLSDSNTASNQTHDHHYKVDMLQCFWILVYRRMLKISWKDKVSNSDVLNRINRKRATILQGILYDRNPLMY